MKIAAPPALFLTAIALVLIGTFAVTAHSAHAATYHTTGTTTSKNLMKDTGADSIDAFGYNISELPANTSVKVQFSQMREQWVDASGTEGAWTTLSAGDNTAQADGVDLSSLNWAGPYFFYRMKLETSDTGATPVVSGIELHYTSGEIGGTHLTVATSTSKNILKDKDVDTVDKFGYNVSSLPSGTSIKIQFSQMSRDWYAADGTKGAWTTLSSGDNTAEADAIDLSNFNWTGAFLFYRVKLETTDTGKAPVLSEVKPYYTEGSSASYHQTGTTTTKDLFNEKQKPLEFRYNAPSIPEPDIPSGTAIKVQFSKDGSTWVNAASSTGQWEDLKEGGNAIDLESLGWGRIDEFYYRLRFESNDANDKTPVLFGTLVKAEADAGVRIHGGTTIGPGSTVY